MATNTRFRRRSRKIIRIGSRMLVLGAALLVLLYLVFLIPSVQVWAAGKAADWLSNRAGTEVQVEKVKLRPVKWLELGGLYIEDYDGDTLLYAENLEASFSGFNPFRRQVFVSDMKLHRPVFRMHRPMGDSIFTFTTWTRSLGSPASADVEEKVSEKPPWKLALGGLDVYEARFRFDDVHAMTFFKVDIDHLLADVKSTSLAQQTFDMHKLQVDGMNLNFEKRDEPRGIPWKPPIDTPNLNTSGWKLYADRFEFNNSSFQFNDWRKPVLEGLDFTHLDIEDINLAFDNVRFEGDTIEAQIAHMQAIDKAGLEMQDLTGHLHMTNRELEITDFELKTPHSRLANYLKMDYGSFHAWENFIPDMVMDAQFEGSVISMKDLQLFADELDLIQGDIGLTGHIYGKVTRLRGRDVLLNYGKRSRFAGEFSIDDLPEARESFIEFDMDELLTNAADLDQLLPELAMPESMPALGDFTITGEFIGFPSDFVAYGDLQSDLGYAESDLNLKVNDAQNQVNYSGKFNLENFALGKWTQQPDILGTVSMTSNVEGTGKARGLALENIDADIDAVVGTFAFKGYQYESLNFDGNFRQGFFEGSLESADPNFDQRFEGTVDFSGADPVFDFESDIRSLDLYALNLVPDPFRLQGQLEFNITGDDIDSILGTAGFRNLTIHDGEVLHKLDSLIVNASEEAGVRTLDVESEPFSAHFDGNFALTQMPDAIKKLVVHYFPESGLEYDTLIADQDLNFTVSVVDSRQLTDLFFPTLGRIQQSFLTGSFNSAQNEFDIRAAFPVMPIGKVGMNQLRVDIQTNENQIDLFASTESMDLSEKMRTPLTVLEGGYRDDSLFFQLLVGRDTDIDRMNLNGAITSYDDAFRFSILPSEIVTRNDRWQISPNNSLAFDGKKFTAEDFSLYSEDQLVSINTFEKPGYNSWIEVSLENLYAGRLMSAFQVNPVNLTGKVNGKLTVTDLLTNPAYRTNIRVQDFTVDNLELGTLTAMGSLVQPGDQINFIGGLVGENSVRVKGELGLQQKEVPISASLEIDQLDAKPFARYLAGVFDQIDGKISGDIQLEGTVKNPRFSGFASISDAQLRLMYTNVLYRAPQVDLNVKDNRLVFDPATIYDPYDNTGTLTGALLPNTLSDWDFQNLQVLTDNMLFMETTRASNPEMYGTAFGSGSALISGNLSDVDIVLNAESNRGTEIFIPISFGPSLSATEFIQFVDPNASEEEKENNTRRNISRVNFKFYLDVNELAEVEIDIGDKLRGNGRGSLQLDINNRGDFTMSGIYTVTKGSYAFSLQDLLTKDFDIDPGSQITWNGDPYAAQLDVRAVYEARATEWDLISEFENSMTAQEIRNARQPKDVDVYLNLTGLLESPSVDFDIKMRQGQSGGTSVFDRRLQQIRADKNELSKQVFGLLVMNRFIPDESGINPLLSSASNSVSEFLSKQLSVYVSDWVSQFITDVDVDIKYTTYSSIESELSQQELQVVLSKNFLDDRIYVNVGGNFGVGANTTGTAAPGDNVAGDFEIEYAITADGRFRIKAFQRTDFDLLLGRNIGETGVGLFYSQEFDSLFDLGQDRKRRKALRQSRREDALKEEETGQVTK